MGTERKEQVLYGKNSDITVIYEWFLHLLFERSLFSFIYLLLPENQNQ